MRPWWWRLAGYARPEFSNLTFLSVLALATVGTELLRPWPIKLIVDHVLPAKPLPAAAAWIQWLPAARSQEGQLAWLSAATVVIFGAGWLISLAQTYVQTGVGNRLRYQLAADAFDHLQWASLGYHRNRTVGDLVKRVTQDSICIKELILDCFLPMITALVTLAALFVMMWTLNSELALITISVAPFLAILMKFFARPMADRQQLEADLQGQMMATAEQALTALPVVQAFGREPLEHAKFAAVTERVGGAYLGKIKCQLQFEISTDAIVALGTATIMAVGGFRVLSGRLSIGDLLIFLSYIYSIFTPLSTLTYLSWSYTSASVGARRVFELIDKVDTLGQKGVEPHHEPILPVHGHIRVENVTFGYKEGQPAIRGVTIEAVPGESIALVGETGAGKTTVAALIARLYDPWEGRVTLDGIDIRHFSVTTLRSQVALVFQDPFLLPLSIAENIAYGRPEASREQIIAAAVAANADRFIRKLPGGYDTVIGERGSTLSGGERQRLAIARAFLKDSPILVLDEPTSALDAETEAELLDALQRLMVNRTTIIIAHRFSTTRHVNRVFVLARGQVVQSGKPKDLISVEGRYRRLHSLQAGATN